MMGITVYGILSVLVQVPIWLFVEVGGPLKSV